MSQLWDSVRVIMKCQVIITRDMERKHFFIVFFCINTKCFWFYPRNVFLCFLCHYISLFSILFCSFTLYQIKSNHTVNGEQNQDWKLCVQVLIARQWIFFIRRATGRISCTGLIWEQRQWGKSYIVLWEQWKHLLYEVYNAPRLPMKALEEKAITHSVWIPVSTKSIGNDL